MKGMDIARQTSHQFPTTHLFEGRGGLQAENGKGKFENTAGYSIAIHHCQIR